MDILNREIKSKLFFISNTFRGVNGNSIELKPFNHKVISKIIVRSNSVVFFIIKTQKPQLMKLKT